MHSYNEDIITILDPRVDRILLRGLYLSIFNEEKSKFYAATFVEIEPNEYEKISYCLNKLGTSSSYTLASNERMKKYLTPTSYHHKSTDECVSEGIFKSYSIRFIGVLHEGEWFILKELTYFGEELREDAAKNYLNRPINTADYWDSAIFRPGVALTLSNGKTLPNKEIEQFGNVPYMVALIKKERKEAINRAYCRYMNEAVFLPFEQSLKIKYPNEYYNLQTLYGEDFSLLFPENKKYAIMIAMAHNRNDTFTIVYFLYDALTGKYYDWVYPEKEEHGASFFYGLEVIDFLKKISIFDDVQYLSYNSLTLDDPDFWENYVLKKSKGHFLYLKEIDV